MNHDKPDRRTGLTICDSETDLCVTVDGEGEVVPGVSDVDVAREDMRAMRASSSMGSL